MATTRRTNRNRQIVIAMKKYICLCICILLALACGPDPNRGYGYNVKTEPPRNSVSDTASRPQEKESWAARAARNNEARYMDLYDLNGKKVDYCRVLKGQFDGHTWYVFTDREGEFCVIQGD